MRGWPGCRQSCAIAALAGMSCFIPDVTLAHSFGQTYTLPVPVWMYLYGASAALVLSFVIVAYFVGAPRGVHETAAGEELPATNWLNTACATRRVLQVLSVFGLVVLHRHRPVRHEQQLRELQHDLLLGRVRARIHLPHGRAGRFLRGAESLARDDGLDRAPALRRVQRTHQLPGAIFVLAGFAAVHGVHLDRAVRANRPALAERDAARLHRLDARGHLVVRTRGLVWSRGILRRASAADCEDRSSSGRAMLKE